MFFNLVLTLFLFLAGREQSNADKMIAWHPEVKLMWSHFQMPPPHRDDIVALTTSGISFGFSVKEENSKPIDFETQVIAHFYSERSWVHKNEATDYILAHEQLHFDITELHARKLKKQMGQLKISNNIKRQLNAAYARINKDMAIMQNTYDKETNHSIDTLVQSAWKRKIDIALAEYNNYK